jgi:DNA-binding Lrp family transcriptional regulator
MAIAFVLIRTYPGHEREVYYHLHRLNKDSGISEVHPVIGYYNLIAKIKADTCEELGYIVLNKINHIKEISSTETLNAIQF